MDLRSDRRDNQRIKYEAIIWHSNILPGIFYKAKLSNLSKTGIYFETDQSLYPGEKICIAKKSDSSVSNRKEFNRVEINRHNGNTKDFDRIEIKWRKELKNSSYRYGYGAILVDSNSHLEQLIEISGGSLFEDLKLKGWVVRLDPKGFGVKFDRRSGRERRTDLERRRGPDRRTRRKPKRRSKIDELDR